jgi:hypothetical protein
MSHETCTKRRTLFLNEVDLVTPQRSRGSRHGSMARFHPYRLIESRGGNVPLEILLSVGRFGSAQLDDALPHLQPDHFSQPADDLSSPGKTRS